MLSEDKFNKKLKQRTKGPGSRKLAGKLNHMNESDSERAQI